MSPDHLNVQGWISLFFSSLLLDVVSLFKTSVFQVYGE